MFMNFRKYIQLYKINNKWRHKTLSCVTENNRTFKNIFNFSQMRTTKVKTNFSKMIFPGMLISRLGEFNHL